MKYLLHILLYLTIQCFLVKSTFGSAHNLGPKIISGNKAKDKQFPWQAALIAQARFCRTLCGGVLISDQWIITAAHCVDSAHYVNISLGSNRREGNDFNRVRSKSEEYYQHDHYNFRTLENDIAVVRLPKPIPFNEYIQPITLTTTALNVGSDVVISGWGATRDNNNTYPLHLNYDSLVTISDKECLRAYSRVVQGSFCASQKGKLLQGPCHGDSGGPVVFHSHGDVKLVGIISYGFEGKCETGKPAGFVSIDFYRNWIKKKTGV